MSLSFSELSLFSFSFFTFWHNKMFQVYLYFLFSSPGISHLSKDAGSFFLEEIKQVRYLENKVWELSELITCGLLLLLVDSAGLCMCAHICMCIH